MIRTALISVSDKSKLEILVPLFKEHQTRILSTGNTAVVLEQLGLKVETVSSFTGYPEILGGRVKSLHPKIYAGILCDLEKAEHRADLEQINTPVIDLVICNLYPFQKTVARPDCTLATAIENIDVGGPSMIRAAAKNFKHVAVLVAPDQYEEFVRQKKVATRLDYDYHFRLATQAFEHTAEYDQAIQTYFKNQQKKTLTPSNPILEQVSNTWHLQPTQNLRYGENPHQSAQLYQISEIATASQLQQLHGKEISYNNILDFEAALNLAGDFENSMPANEAPFWVGIFKHLNPCGIGISHHSIHEAFQKAFDCDPISPFGGIIIANQTITTDFVQALGSLFLEAIIAPEFDATALEQLKAKKNIRLMQRLPQAQQLSPNNLANLQLRSTHLGLLVQEKDRLKNTSDSFKIVTQKKPSKEEFHALKFAWLVVKQLRSNAIAFTSASQTLALGIGQTNRVLSLKIALNHLQALHLSTAQRPIVCASDAFFPFSDSIELLKGSPVSAIIQPGGSIKDAEVIAACDQQGLAMIFTGERHFTH